MLFSYFILFMIMMSALAHYMDYSSKKKLMESFLASDSDPKSLLSYRAIQMIKDGEAFKAVKRIKNETGLNIEDSKKIFIKVKWHLAKRSE